MNDFRIQKLFLAGEYQKRALPCNETTLRTTDRAVVVNTMPVPQDVKIVLLSHSFQQHNRCISRLFLQLRHPIFVCQSPKLLKLFIIIQRLSYFIININPLVVQPYRKSIEGSWVGIHEVKLQGFGFVKVAMVVKIVEEYRVFGKNA